MGNFLGQRLCEDVGIPPRDSVTQCKKVTTSSNPLPSPQKKEKEKRTNPPKTQALKAVHINIHDLVAAKQVGQHPRRFPTRQALRDYIVATNKWFSKEVAKRNGFLKALLIEVWG